MSRKIGEHLVREGLLSPGQLAQALDAQLRSGGTIGNQLVALGLVHEDVLARAIGRLTGLPAVSRTELFAAPPEIVGLLSADFARRHRALPFRVEGERLLLAVDDPADNAALDEAAFLTGFSIAPHVAPESALTAALVYHHGAGPGALPMREVAPGDAYSAPAVADQPEDRPPEDRPEDEQETGPTDSLDQGPAAAAAALAHAGSDTVLVQGAAPGGTLAAPAPALAAVTAPRPQMQTQAQAPRREEQGPEPARAAEPDPAEVEPGTMAAPTDWSETGRRLASAAGRDEIIEIAADAMALLLPRVIVFAVRGEQAVAITTRGLAERGSRELSVPVSDPGVLAPALAGRLQYGPLQLGSAERDFYTLLGGRAPAAALVIPVALRGRTVLVLYGDDPGHARAAPAFDDARRLASLFGAAVEIAVLRARILREAGVA